MFDRCIFDSLESRLILDATLAGGVLTVNGSANADTITLTLNGANIDVVIQPEAFNSPFVNANVTSIVINGLAQNDSITVDAALTQGTTINSGLGDDTVNGGGGADNIDAGDGNDRVDPGLGNDSLEGGGGTDTLTYQTRAAD